MERAKLDELRTREPEDVTEVWLGGEIGSSGPWVKMYPDDRDALFAYIDELERQIARREGGGTGPLEAAPGSGGGGTWAGPPFFIFTLPADTAPR